MTTRRLCCTYEDDVSDDRRVAVFPEFDERGARHWFGTGRFVKPARHHSHEWRWAHYLNHLPSDERRRSDELRRIFEAETLRRRDAAFRLAFRRCGGILPRFAGLSATMIDDGADASAWYPGLTHTKVTRGNTR